MQDLLKLSIVNMDVEDITPDILKSYEMMLTMESFAKYHKDISDKIADYKKANGVIETPIKSEKFSMKIGDFFRTFNGNIVMVWGTTTDFFLVTIVEIKAKLTPKLAGINGATLTEQDFKNVSNIGGQYKVNFNGQMLGLTTIVDGFPLNLKTKLKANFIEEKESIERKQK